LWVHKNSTTGTPYTLRVSRTWIEIAAPVCPNATCPNHLPGMIIR
jgi:hypothetical protein